MYLGLDVGTTATKAILVDDDQVVRGTAQASYPTCHPGPGLSEQDPSCWIEAVRAVMAALRVDAAGEVSAVRSVGLSGQMHSLVTLGADQAALGPAILWNDVRGREECRLLQERVPDIGTMTGVVPMPSFTAAKLLWTARHAPARFAAIRHVVLPKDYVRLWLTGDLAVDVSDAAGAQLLHGATRTWAMPVVDAIGLPHACLPPLVEAVEVAGRLRPRVAAELGLPAGLPVAAGGGDAAMAAVGLGCVRPGTSFISLGTGALVAVAQDRFAPLPETMLHDFAHAVPGTWYQMAAMLNGASCLAWAARLLGQADVPRMLDQVRERHVGPSRVMFLPYLSGERTPHNDDSIRACFVGLDSATDPVDVAQAVLEGVAFAIRDAVRTLDDAGCPVSMPALVGGGARSPFWSGLIATVLGRPLSRNDNVDLGPALGAARLAMTAAGAAGIREIAGAPTPGALVEPNALHVDAYADRYAKFGAAYRALKDVHPIA